MSFLYRADVLIELSRHGVIPTTATPPELAREYVNDLYCYEVRALRNSFLAGNIHKRDYARRVAELRDKYPILSLPTSFWTIGDREPRPRS
jgi:hypothetical protein